VTLAGAGVGDRDHILAASDALAAGQLQAHCLVARGDRRDVETVQGFHCREPSPPDAALDRPPFPADRFGLGQARRIAGVIDPRGGALPGELAVFARERRRRERLEMRREQRRRRVADDAAPPGRARQTLAEVVATRARGRQG
jgi:hypothetical protein